MKLAGVPQTPEPISAASVPKFTIFLRTCREDIDVLTIFYSDYQYMP